MALQMAGQEDGVTQEGAFAPHRIASELPLGRWVSAHCQQLQEQLDDVVGMQHLVDEQH